MNVAGARPPTLADFIRHAELYGTADLYEAAEKFLGESELVQLSLAIHESDIAHRKKFTTVKTRKRLSREQRLRAVDFLIREGAPHSRIAVHLGVSERTVRSMARTLRERAETAIDRKIAVCPAPASSGAEMSPVERAA